MEDPQKQLRRLAVLLTDAEGLDNSSTLLTVFLPASADVKTWEAKLGHRPKSRTTEDGEYMKNISRASEYWEQFKHSAADAQKLFRQCVQENKGSLPKNGIVMYVGSSDPRQTVVFEPPVPVQATVHLCDDKYHVEYLSALTCQSQYGFIIVDGNGCLFGTLCGNEKRVMEKFSVDLPNKHSKGGQSALRFARLRLEKRHNYVRKVCERASQCFISDDSNIISGLIVAGVAELKQDLVSASNSMLDSRLRRILMATFDVAYGGENGFNQAISLSVETLKNQDYMKEKHIISDFMHEIARCAGVEESKACFGVDECMAALECGAVHTLIVWDQLPLQRLVVKNLTTGACSVRFTSLPLTLTPDLEIEETSRLVDWIIDNRDSFGARLEFITDRSQEGSQFCKGFGGIGGLLQYHPPEIDDALVDQSTDYVETDSDFE